jgi:hypothetical protein
MNWRRVAVVAGALCAGFVPSATALAHNGIGAAFKGHAGPYIVYAYDGESLPAGRLDYKLVLLNGNTKNPVYDVHPTVTATRAGAPAATARITTFGNVIFYNLPNPYPHHWEMHLRIRGSLGTGQVRYRMHGAAAAPSDQAPVVVTDPGSGGNWPLIIGSALGALALAGALLLLVRRSALRRRASPR